MNKEDKELLLKDLCARLPYRIIVHIHDIDVDDYDRQLIGEDLDFIELDRRNCKPYLRQMSSMTDEEKKIRKDYYIYHFSGNNLPDNEGDFVFEDEAHEYIDWLNKNHFDYRGLIGRGLAIEVTEENNPYKK